MGTRWFWSLGVPAPFSPQRSHGGPQCLRRHSAGWWLHFCGSGNAPDANSVPVGKEEASNAFESAVCVGCGACVASCKNASASLFTGAKINHLGNLPQGRPEGARRAIRMVETMEEHRGFGACSNTLECEAACPKEIFGESHPEDEQRLPPSRQIRPILQTKERPGVRCLHPPCACRKSW